jgi:hypothetical protein
MARTDKLCFITVCVALLEAFHGRVWLSEGILVANVRKAVIQVVRRGRIPPVRALLSWGGLVLRGRSEGSGGLNFGEKELKGV